MSSRHLLYAALAILVLGTSLTLARRFAPVPNSVAEVKSHYPDPSPVACTKELKLCPNGSTVGRIGPDCRFAPCPATPADCTCPTGAYCRLPAWCLASPTPPPAGGSTPPPVKSPIPYSPRPSASPACQPSLQTISFDTPCELSGFSRVMYQCLNGRPVTLPTTKCYQPLSAYQQAEFACGKDCP